jgi:6-methylsalicylate decarboxylase
MSHDEALDVHAYFLPTPYLEVLRSAGVTTVDNGIPVPGWEVGQAIEVIYQAGIGCGMLSVSSPFLHFLDQAETPALCRTINDSALARAANRLAPHRWRPNRQFTGPAVFCRPAPCRCRGT